MPSVSKTPNYELNQWQGNEYPKRQDFVDDNEKIDAQMKSNSNNIIDHKEKFNVHGDTSTLERSGKDSEGIFTSLIWKRLDGTKYKQSVLSGGTTPEYTTRTVTYYDTDGTTVLDTVAYTLSYDIDGDLISEVIS